MKLAIKIFFVRGEGGDGGVGLSPVKLLGGQECPPSLIDENRAEVVWSVRYLQDFRLPDKTLDWVDQACAAVRFRTLTPQGKMAGGETPPQRPGAGRASHDASEKPAARRSSQVERKRSKLARFT